MKRLLFAVLILFASPHLSLATHIIGGELNYRCLGGNLYEIHLRVYRDCYYGDPDFDDPAAVGVFSANNNLITTVYIPFDTKQKLDPTFNQANPCVKIPANVCVEATEYVTTVTLPAIAGGYQLTYQRCCRNQTVVNLQNPNNVGATYYAVIPPKSMATCNSNPVFKAWPPIFVCRNMDINFDHSATDADGDSIAYHLCKPFDGASFSIPKPTVPSAPPYSYIPWINPYTTNDPLGGVPLNIDPKTGWLTGSPNR